MNSRITRAALLRASFLTVLIVLKCNVCVAQSPQPQPQPSGPHFSLAPLVLLSVGMDGISKPFRSPTGINFPTPEFFVPRNGSKTFDVSTSGGNVTVTFSNSLPAGIPASAFQWIQQSASAPNAAGKLLYNGCTSCPASFVVELSASSRNSVAGTIKLNLTATTGKPQLISITRNGGTDVKPRYEIKFAAGTFDPSDSEVVGRYAGNLKYRLTTESGSNFASGSLFVVIPRLKASRNVEVFLRNPYGTSTNLNTDLPLQQVENGPGQFNCINCSTVFGNARIDDEYSVKHNNSGILDMNGTDDIVIGPLRSGVTPCDEPDVIYHTALVRWIRDDGYSGDSADQGTVSVLSHPPADQLLRAPQNKIQIAWMLKAFKGERWYQVMFGAIDVVGVCPNRVVQ